MLKDASNNTKIEIPTSMLMVAFIGLLLLVLGIFSFSALGYSSFM